MAGTVRRVMAEPHLRCRGYLAREPLHLLVHRVPHRSQKWVFLRCLNEFQLPQHVLHQLQPRSKHLSIVAMVGTCYVTQQSLLLQLHNFAHQVQFLICEFDSHKRLQNEAFSKRVPSGPCYADYSALPMRTQEVGDVFRIGLPRLGTRCLLLSSRYFLGTGGNPLFAASNMGINFSRRGVPSFTAKYLSAPLEVFPHSVTPA